MLDLVSAWHLFCVGLFAFTILYSANLSEMYTFSKRIFIHAKKKPLNPLLINFISTFFCYTEILAKDFSSEFSMQNMRMSVKEDF